MIEVKGTEFGFFLIRFSSIFQSECNFVIVTETLVQIFDNDPESYWLAKGFFALTKEIEKELPKLIEFTYSLLEKEDHQLYK